MLKLIALTALSGSVFTMCDGGPVPPGCCDAGDQLNVITTSAQTCEDYGGKPEPLGNGIPLVLCVDVDF